MSDVSHLLELIRDVPDFPEEGIIFKDITPMLQNAEAFRAAVDMAAEPLMGEGIDVVLGAEARGFVIGAPLAYKIGAGFALVRKPGKLPWEKTRATYELEYGTDALEIHTDAVSPGMKVLIADDVLATGGTAAACVSLVESLGGQMHGLTFFIELAFLNGRERLAPHPVQLFDTIQLKRFTARESRPRSSAG